MLSWSNKNYSIPIALGIAFFCLVVGLDPIDPHNLSWIFGRFDPPKDYLGWVFYRNTPWSFPIGSNPNYGLDIGSSIVYSDSVPLMAIFFKLLSPLLGTPFQYFGIWLILCFILQVFFSWKIISLFSKNTLVVLFGSGLLAFAPPMIWRIDTPSGMQAGLVAHFLILGAIYLSLKAQNTKRALYWTILLCSAALTHFYIFAMVGFLWGANLLDAVISQKVLSLKRAITEFCVVTLALFVVAWQAGYFMINSSAGIEWGYGFFKLNLLGPINPEGWSYVLPSIPIPTSWGEGFNYLGLGAITAIAISLIQIILSHYASGIGHVNKIYLLLKKYRFLIFCLLLLFLDALSNNIGIGPKDYYFKIPTSAYTLLSILRSSARMYWPVHYLLIIAALYFIIKSTKTGLLISLLGLLFFIQIIDTSSGWLSVRKSLSRDMSDELHSPLLKAPFWRSAANHYKKIIRIPAKSQTPYWLQFASLASANNMSTNSVYLARVDSKQVANANQKLIQILADGNFDPSALYILEQRYVIPALLSATSNDLIAIVDGFFVLSPKWLDCELCKESLGVKRMNVSDFRPMESTPIGFTNQIKDQKSIFYLGDGWSWQENWGTWSDGSNAIINFPWPNKTPKNLKITFKTLVVTDLHPTQKIDVVVNNYLHKQIVTQQFDENEVTIPISKSMLTFPFLKIEFRFHNPGQPSTLFRNNKDQRNLGIGLVSVKFD